MYINLLIKHTSLLSLDVTQSSFQLPNTKKKSLQSYLKSKVHKSLKPEWSTDFCRWRVSFNTSSAHETTIEGFSAKRELQIFV